MDRKDVNTWPQEFKDVYNSDPKYAQIQTETAYNMIRGKLSFTKLTTLPMTKVEKD